MSDILYATAFDIFGVRKRVGGTGGPKRRKFTSPWFNTECEQAKRDFKSASNRYKRNKTQGFYDILIKKRKEYKIVKRKAKCKFKIQQKATFHEVSKNNPKKFWELIRKYKGKNKKNSEVSSQDFYDHFYELLSNNDNFENEDVTKVLNDNTLDATTVAELDSDFTVDELFKAISSLKRGENPGIDNLIPEIFLECKNLLAPILCPLFNYIYNAGIYPESWTKGVLVPVPKKGDLTNVDNYRGIMITSIFSKLFSQLLDNRLRK